MQSKEVEGASPSGDSRKKPAREDNEPSELTSPIQVIADIVFKDGLLFLTVENISDQPTYQVSIQWKPSFRGQGGTQATSDLPLFKNIEFLAPHKTIETLLDTSQAYFQRNEPTRLEAVVQHLDVRGRTYRHTIHHDLEIYRDLAYQTPNDWWNKNTSIIKK